ncbi:MAG: hypothetical protein CSB48_11455 [Proteobacteria bacterium]|nr:MAG: hypothetical protein CSB48_11455 [Pseudomonadota bacterium]PIE39890.1 MAG: hypothetical protein CSA51_03690 [Gammaproteobacteria bacterium]
MSRVPMKKNIITLFLLLFACALSAEEIRVDPREPQITIRHGEGKTFFEYRVNGVLKEIKVKPANGPEYYLVPVDGGGWIREEKSQLLVPAWVIFRW